MIKERDLLRGYGGQPLQTLQTDDQNLNFLLSQPIGAARLDDLPVPGTALFIPVGRD